VGFFGFIYLESKFFSVEEEMGKTKLLWKMSFSKAIQSLFSYSLCDVILSAVLVSRAFNFLFCNEVASFMCAFESFPCKCLGTPKLY